MVLLADFTLAHAVYIPGVMLLAGALGYFLGGRAAEMAGTEEQEKASRRAARRARRNADRDGE